MTLDYRWRLAFVKKFIGFLVALGIVCFLVLRLWLKAQAFEGISPNFHLPWLVASFATLLLYQSALVAPWIALLRQYERSLNFRTGFSIFHLSNLGRYLPAKIGFIVGMVVLCKRAGIGKAEAFLSTLLQLGFLVFCGVLISAASFWLFPAFDTPLKASLFDKAPIFGLAVLIGVLVLALSGDNVLRMVTEKFFGIRLPKRFSGFLFLRFLASYLLLWCSCGLAFFLFVKSLFPLGWGQLPAIVGAYALAWTIGFLSFITPGGLGVREGVLSFLLSGFMPQTTAILIALLSRGWNIVADLVLAAIAVGFFGTAKRRKKATPSPLAKGSCR